MKNTVIIKSFQNGISVYLNEDIPFPELLEEVIFGNGLKIPKDFLKMPKWQFLWRGEASPMKRKELF